MKAAAALTYANAEDPLSIPLANFTYDLAMNTTSAYVAAHEAVLAFQELPSDASKTFIYTGNAMNDKPAAPYMGLGLGKTATAHAIQIAATTYKDVK